MCEYASAGSAPEAILSSEFGHPANLLATQYDHVLSLFTGYDYEPLSRLYFNNGRPWSTETGFYLTENQLALSTGATNLYQRSSGTPIW